LKAALRAAELAPDDGFVRERVDGGRAAEGGAASITISIDQANVGFGCAPCKGGAFQWVQIPSGCVESKTGAAKSADAQVAAANRIASFRVLSVAKSLSSQSNLSTAAPVGWRLRWGNSQRK
jgi:hypothetical protein